MNQLHHIELPPLGLHNAPRLPPVPKQPQTRMDTGFSPFAPTALTTSAGSNRIARRNVPGVAIRGPIFFIFSSLPSLLLAAVEVIGPPRHQFGAVIKVGPTVVSSPRAIALDVGQTGVHTTPP